METLQAPPAKALSSPSTCPQGCDPLPGTHLAARCEPHNPLFLPSLSKHGCRWSRTSLRGPCYARRRYCRSLMPTSQQRSEDAGTT